jgi:hypothetical protein
MEIDDAVKLSGNSKSCLDLGFRFLKNKANETRGLTPL